MRPLLPTRRLPTKNEVNKYVIRKSEELQGRVVNAFCVVLIIKHMDCTVWCKVKGLSIL